MVTKRIPKPEDDVQPGGAAWQVAVNQPGDALDDDSEVSEELAIVDRIRATLAQSGDGISIKLFRVDQFTKKREFCQNYAPHDLENIEERVREQWGAGTYEVKIFNSRGIAPGGRIMVTLAAPVKSAAVTVAPAIPDAITAAFQRIAETQAAMMEAIAQTNARLNAAPVATPQEQMKSMLELLTMAKAISGGAAPAPAVSQAEMMREVFSMIKEAKSAVRELSDDEPASDPDNPMTMVREFLQTARSVMQQPQAAPQLPAPTLPHLAVPSSFSSNETDEASDVLNLQKHIAELEMIQKRSGDVEEAAQYLYSWMPAGLVPLLSGDTWFAMLSTVAPALAANREWCDKVRTRVMELFEEAKKQGLL